MCGLLPLMVDVWLVIGGLMLWVYGWLWFVRFIVAVLVLANYFVRFGCLQSAFVGIIDRWLHAWLLCG